jgi:hypothetical protein
MPFMQEIVLFSSHSFYPQKLWQSVLVNGQESDSPSRAMSRRRRMRGR